MPSPGYAWEKFSLAVYCLNGREGSVKDRLHGAGEYLIRLNPDDFPTPDLTLQFEEIMAALREHEPEGGTGRLELNIRMMTDLAAAGIARRIRDLHSKLDPYRDT